MSGVTGWYRYPNDSCAIQRIVVLCPIRRFAVPWNLFVLPNRDLGPQRVVI